MWRKSEKTADFVNDLTKPLAKSVRTLRTPPSAGARPFVLLLKICDHGCCPRKWCQPTGENCCLFLHATINIIFFFCKKTHCWPVRLSVPNFVHRKCPNAFSFGSLSRDSQAQGASASSHIGTGSNHCNDKRIKMARNETMTSLAARVALRNNCKILSCRVAAPCHPIYTHYRNWCK